MRVIIAGSRDIEDYGIVKQAIMQSGFAISTIVSGHCSGVDSLAERYAMENGIPVDVHPANWAKYGRAAGPKRNAEMAEVADALIAVMHPVSKGTQSMVNIATRKGLKVFTLIVE